MVSPEREPRQSPDPFENLRLDEGFVRAARFIEPSAAERMRGGDRRDPGRCQVVPAHRRLSPGMHRMVWAPHPGRRGRRAARIIAMIAVLAGVISIIVALRHGGSRTAGTTTSAATGPAPVSPSQPAAVVPPRSAGGIVVSAALLASLREGSCVDWDPTTPNGGLAARVVPCGEDHRAEVVRMVRLDLRFPGENWPGVAALDAVAAAECGTAFADYVARVRPPDATPVRGSLEPGAEAWAAGARQLACTVQRENLAPWRDTLDSPAVST
ncbi:MAG: septum formation family protein [Frankia sp.]|nr:septum formation family protein [Frankia sp.]